MVLDGVRGQLHVYIDIRSARAPRAEPFDRRASDCVLSGADVGGELCRILSLGAIAAMMARPDVRIERKFVISYE